MDRRRATRLTVVIVMLAVAGVLVHGYVTAPTTASAADVPRPDPRDGITVVSESAKFGTLIAWNPDGSLLYYDDDHTKYFDVDPVAGTATTVEYVAVDTIHSAGPRCRDPPCTRNVVERVNLSTGAIREIYARYDAKEHAAEWHDHERVDSDRILVADMIHDQVVRVNTTTELVDWRWDGQSDFDVTTGGPYPDDWMHLNDVEVLPDGRIMVSLRNHDQIVFLDPVRGLQTNWTLGADDDHDILYEQHNPQYIPADRGGPAVVLADSENGRVLEYQRQDGTWNRTWHWADDRLQWPRDADRLPNGHTLVADTHGKRVLEIDRDGDVVWSVPVSHPYDVERLGVSGGESAARLGLTSRTADSASETGFDPLGILGDLVTAVLPSRLVNAVIYVAPVWMGRVQYFAIAIGVVTTVIWLGLEVRWRVPPLGTRWPIYRRDE